MKQICLFRRSGKTPLTSTEKFLLTVKTLEPEKLKLKKLLNIEKINWDKKTLKSRNLLIKSKLSKDKLLKPNSKSKRKKSLVMIWNSFTSINSRSKIRSTFKKLMIRIRSCLSWRLLLEQLLFSYLKLKLSCNNKSSNIRPKLQNLKS